MEVDAYSKEEQQIAKGRGMIEECMDEIIYALTSKLWVMDLCSALYTSRMKML